MREDRTLSGHFLDEVKLSESLIRLELQDSRE